MQHPQEVSVTTPLAAQTHACACAHMHMDTHTHALFPVVSFSATFANRNDRVRPSGSTCPFHRCDLGGLQPVTPGAGSGGSPSSAPRHPHGPSRLPRQRCEAVPLARAVPGRRQGRVPAASSLPACTQPGSPGPPWLSGERRGFRVPRTQPGLLSCGPLSAEASFSRPQAV